MSILSDALKEKRWVIFALGLLLGNSMGVIIPMTSTHMKQNGVSTAVVGMVEFAYFIVLALTSMYIKFKFKSNDIKSIINRGLMVNSICAMLFPLVAQSYIWFALMAVMGVGVGFYMVGVQTMLQKFSTKELRAYCNGLYTLFFAVGFASGFVLGPVLYQIEVKAAFIYSAITFILAVFLLKFKLKGNIIIESEGKINSLKVIFIPATCAFVYGYLENTVSSLYPLFLTSNGYTLNQVGISLGAFVIGGVLGTIPMVSLSEKIGKKNTLIILLIGAFASIIGILMMNILTGKLVFSFAAGVFVGAFYPLAISLGTVSVREEEYLALMSYITFLYGLGSAFGPLVSSLCMQILGENNIFLSSIVVIIVNLIVLISLKGNEKNYG